MKKKILAMCLIIALLAIAITGATLAYFTDTDQATNVFTAGDVKIDLTEAAVIKDNKGNLIEDTSKDRKDLSDDDNEEDTYDYGKVYPGQSIHKDPTITNLGSEDAYIAAKITITDGEGDLNNVIGTGYNDMLDITALVSGGYVQKGLSPITWNDLYPVHGGDTYHIYQTTDRANGTYVLYFFAEGEKKTNDEVELFDTLKIPETWDNAEMKELVDLSIKIEAFAVQAYGFDTCYEAITAAFPTEFAACIPQE